MTSFDSLLDQCTCFRTRQTAHLSRSSPGVGFHPNHHPNQGFIRVYVICCNCVNWFQNRTVLYIIAHYLQPSPTSSPVSRTNPMTVDSIPAAPKRPPAPRAKPAKSAAVNTAFSATTGALGYPTTTTKPTPAPASEMAAAQLIRQLAPAIAPPPASSWEPALNAAGNAMESILFLRPGSGVRILT